MNKINFQNLPNTTTPVNATNLNQVQTNVENAINSVDTAVTNLQTEVNTKSTYSTTETVIGTWIDGKPIYRKVIDIGNLPNNDYKDVAHNINNIRDFTKIDAIINTGTGYYYSLNMRGTSVMFADNTTVIRADTTKIQIGTTGNYSAQSGYAILEYTKTTD